MMQILTELGIIVPRDIRIVGFDDLSVSSLLPVPLTTIKQPIDLIAAEAVYDIIEKLTHHQRTPRHILLDGELKIRKSCGAHL
jgi:LacI family transcriptional regulator